MAIDFKKTSVIKTANPRKPDEIAAPVIKVNDPNAPRSPYQVEILPAKERVRFSAWMFSHLQLASNSLGNGIHPDVPGKMLLIVFPGDNGNWATSRGSKDKGRSFKNINLIKGLRELGFGGNFFNLEHIGDDEEGKKYYTFEPYNPPAEQQTETKPEAAKKEKVAPAQEAAQEEATQGEDKFN